MASSHQSEIEIIGTDIKLLDSEFGSDIELTSSGDIRIVSGPENLGQAIINRIKTITGELEELGHAEYGSTIYDFIGRQNNQITRDRLKIMIKNCLLMERRIKEINRITIRSFSYIISNQNRESSEKNYLLYNNSRDDKHLASPSIVSNEKKHGVYIINRQNISYDMVEIEISVTPVGHNDPIELIYPFYLDVLV